MFNNNQSSVDLLKNLLANVLAGNIELVHRDGVVISYDAAMVNLLFKGVPDLKLTVEIK